MVGCYQVISLAFCSNLVTLCSALLAFWIRLTFASPGPTNLDTLDRQFITMWWADTQFEFEPIRSAFIFCWLNYIKETEPFGEYPDK